MRERRGSRGGERERERERERGRGRVQGRGGTAEGSQSGRRAKREERRYCRRSVERRGIFRAFVQEGAPGGRIRDGVGCERQPMERRNNGANRRCVSSQIE